MAKRSRNNRAPRETNVSRYRQVRALVIPPMRWKSPTLHNLNNPLATVTDDRRQWHPERWGRPVVSSPRSAGRLVVAKATGNLLPSRVQFADPRKVVVCHRRKTRREILAAKNKLGGGNRAPRRKPTSEVTC